MPRYRFGTHPAFELLVRERRLLVDGNEVQVGSRALDVLIVLVQRAGQVVSRRELIQRVWSGLSVEENNLNVQVSALRRLLGDRSITTVPGRGYALALQPVAAAQTEADARRPPLKTNLPATIPSLIGREVELADLVDLLATHRLITLLGPGGVGKTLLAQHLLRRHEKRFHHGVCFVDVSALSDADAIPGAIAAALQIQPAGDPALAALADGLAPLEVLVVLDGAEHLLPGAARVASAIHDAAPGLRLVITSQAPLHLAAERLYRVGPLSVPDTHVPAAQASAHGAIALFVERARAADARFVLTEEGATAAIDLCRALGGLPLAIELAAWRAPVLGVRGLVDALHEPLDLLAVPNLDVPERLRALRNALAWSHGLLAPRERVVLRRLSVMVGSSDLDLIQRVVGDAPGEGPLDARAVVESLATLVERSLVTVVAGWNAGVRYKLLEAPRFFARDRLRESGEADRLAHRHATAVAAQFKQAFDERFGGREPLSDWHERHLADTDNGHAALVWMRQHGDIDAALTLLPGLMHATPREQRGRHAEMMALGEDFAARADTGPQAALTLTEVACGIFSVDAHRGEALAGEAVEIARRCADRFDDARWMYRALCQRADALFKIAQTDAASACLREARAVERPAWPAIIRMERWLAEIWLADRCDDGDGMYQATLRLQSLQREAGVPEWAYGLANLNGALAGGHADAAVHYGLALVAQLEGTRHLRGLTQTRVQLVGALIECGRLDEARLQSAAAWPLVKRFARIDAWADYQALLAALEGRLEEAAVLCGYGDAICARERIIRTRNEAKAVRRTQTLLRAALSEDALFRLHARGEALRDEDVPAVAFARLDGGA